MRFILICAVLAIAPITVPAQDESSHALPGEALPTTAQALGHTPQWVYEHFGRPVSVNPAFTKCVCKSGAGVAAHECEPFGLLVGALEDVSASTPKRWKTGAARRKKSPWASSAVVYDDLWAEILKAREE